MTSKSYFPMQRADGWVPAYLPLKFRELSLTEFKWGFSIKRTQNNACVCVLQYVSPLLALLVLSPGHSFVVHGQYTGGALFCFCLGYMVFPLSTRVQWTPLNSNPENKAQHSTAQHGTAGAIQERHSTPRSYHSTAASERRKLSHDRGLPGMELLESALISLCSVKEPNLLSCTSLVVPLLLVW